MPSYKLIKDESETLARIKKLLFYWKNQDDQDDNIGNFILKIYDLPEPNETIAHYPTNIEVDF